METREYTVYKFDELSDEGKQKALDRYREFEVDYEWWDCDGLLDLNQEEMKRCRAKMVPDHGVGVDGCWHRDAAGNDIPRNRDGNPIGYYPCYTGLVKYKIAAFDLDRSWYIHFENIRIMDYDLFRRFLRIPKYLWAKLDFRFENGGHWSHSSTTVEFDHQNWGGEFTSREQAILERAKGIFDDKVSDALSSLQKDYEWRLSDECVAEGLRANEYDFTEEGEID